MTVTRRVLAALGLLAPLALCACGGGGGGGGGGNNNGGGGNNNQAKLTVAPLQASVEAQQKLQLTPTVTNVANPAYTYTVVPPTAVQTGSATAAEIASKYGAVDASGLFTTGDSVTPGQRGSVIVRETTHNLSVEVPILIVPPIQTITVTPDTASVLAGQTTVFQATAIDFFNQPVTPLLVDWHAPSNGTIDTTGTFTGKTAGNGTVEAHIGLATPGTAQVTVVGSITGLAILPAGNPIQIETGTTRQFRAVVTDNQGNQLVTDATWTVEPASLGSITTAGVFTAGASGQTGTIKASASGQTATLPVQVVDLITPPTQGIYNVSGTVRISGGAAAAGATITVKLADNTQVDQTTADSRGVYALFLPAGTYTLTATLGSATASATVSLPSQDVRRTVDLTVL